MIELSEVIQTKDGVLVPKGVRLEFKNGIAKYQNHPIERKLLPLQAIKGASGPFLNACCAIVLNDNKGFQQVYNKRYQDWAHCVVKGDYLIVYIWDTREVIDVIPGIHAACKGGPITRMLVNKTTGERFSQVLGWNRWGWAKSLYEMMMWPVYHRPDNGLPLVTKNEGWKPIIDEFNAPVKKRFAYESSVSVASDACLRDTEEGRMELAAKGLAMPDGSYPIEDIDDLQNAILAYGRSKDKPACKAFIIKRANELNAEYMLPAKWGNEAEGIEIVPAATPNQHNVILNNVQIATITAKKLEQVHAGYKEPEDDSDDKSEQEGEKNKSSEKPTDEQPTEVQPVPAYKNTDDYKLIVTDMSGNVLQLNCLNDDVVLVSDLIEEIGEQTVATENLATCIFSGYDKVEGKAFAAKLTAAMLNDLYELLMLLNRTGDKASIAFSEDKTVTIVKGDSKISFDFAKSTVKLDNLGDNTNLVKVFIAQHFNKALQIQ